MLCYFFLDQTLNMLCSVKSRSQIQQGFHPTTQATHTKGQNSGHWVLLLNNPEGYYMDDLKSASQIYQFLKNVYICGNRPRKCENHWLF